MLTQKTLKFCEPTRNIILIDQYAISINPDDYYEMFGITEGVFKNPFVYLFTKKNCVH